MMKNVRARRSASLAVLVLALVGVATPAGATTPTETVHETWDDTFVNVCDGGTADTSDDLTIESHVIGSGDFVLRERGNSGLFYGTFDGRESVTYTNVDNDLYWTSDARWHEKDLRVTEDEDGILTIRVGQRSTSGYSAGTASSAASTPAVSSSSSSTTPNRHRDLLHGDQGRRRTVCPGVLRGRSSVHQLTTPPHTGRPRARTAGAGPSSVRRTVACLFDGLTWPAGKGAHTRARHERPCRRVVPPDGWGAHEAPHGSCPECSPVTLAIHRASSSIGRAADF